MLTNLIESRGKEFSSLIKMGDYLGRALRENVELFYVENGKVTYLTESGGVITANFSIKPNAKLSNIQVDDASILEDKQAFDKVVSKKVSNLLSNLIESDYSEAENSFDEVLGLYETQLSFSRIKERLRDKTERFGESTKIVSSTEFKKLAEIKDKLVEFLKENKDIAKIPEIKNAMKLASVVSKAFNIPKVTLEQLKESGSFQAKDLDRNTIYEHLCRQELIAKELLEAKQNFDTVWANNDLIADLASMIYEKKRNKIEEKVAEVISEIPYFALATKKQISTIFENCLALTEAKISQKDLVDFVATIFEMKKPVKSELIKILNEKYGININNLTDVPTFSNLIKTETVIVASLAKLAPKNSLLKQTLTSLAESLKIKNGAESIDLVDFLNEVFTKAGFKNTINETSLLQYLDFTQVADDLGKIGAILKLLRPVLGGGNPAGGMGGGGGMGGLGGIAGALGGMQPQGSVSPAKPAPLPGNGEEEAMGGLGSEDGDGDPLAGGMGDAQGAAMDVNAEDGMEPDGDEGGLDPMAGGMEGGLEGEEGMEGEMGEDPMAAQSPLDTALAGMEGDEEPAQTVSADDIGGVVASIEDILAKIKSEIGDPGMGGGEEDGEFEGGSGFDDETMEDPSLDPTMGEEGLEGEEGMDGEEGGDFPPEEGESEESSEESDEGEEESEAPPKKGKFPPKK